MGLPITRAERYVPLDGPPYWVVIMTEDDGANYIVYSELVRAETDKEAEAEAKKRKILHGADVDVQYTHGPFALIQDAGGEYEADDI